MNSGEKFGRQIGEWITRNLLLARILFGATLLALVVFVGGRIIDRVQSDGFPTTFVIVGVIALSMVASMRKRLGSPSDQ
jgi:hypothetical protein